MTLLTLTKVTMINGEKGSGGAVHNLEQEMERIRIDGATGGCEKSENMCLMDVEGCGLQSVSDEMVWGAVVPTGPFC